MSDKGTLFGMSINLNQMLLNETKGMDEPYQCTLISVMVLRKQWIF